MMLEQAYKGSGDGFKFIYVFLPFPLLGGLIAVVFYEFVYKKVQEAIQESEGAAGGILDEDDTNIQTAWENRQWLNYYLKNRQ